MSKKKQVSPVPSYGEIWPGQGGVVVDFVPSMGGQPGWYLIAATSAEAEKLTRWGGADHDETGAVSDWDGLANTIALAKSKVDHPAARWARSVTIDGHSDWYIPSRREMRLLWARVPELFQPKWYLSSTQASASNAWIQLFGYGSQGSVVESWEARCRLVRRFSIS